MNEAGISRKKGLAQNQFNVRIKLLKQNYNYDLPASTFFVTVETPLNEQPRD